eukprot:g22483.t1
MTNDMHPISLITVSFLYCTIDGPIGPQAASRYFYCFGMVLLFVWRCRFSLSTPLRFEYVVRRYQIKIDEVDLYYCLRVTDTCVSKLVRTLPGLKRLSLGRCNITNKIFEATKHKRGPLFKLKQLEYLSLRNCHGLFASDLEALVEVR